MLKTKTAAGGLDIGLDHGDLPVSAGPVLDLAVSELAVTELAAPEAKLAPTVPVDTFTKGQLRDGQFIQRCFINRRNYLRKNRLDLAEATFKDGLEALETEDRDRNGKTLAEFVAFAHPLTKMFQGQVMQDVWALFECEAKSDQV